MHARLRKHFADGGTALHRTLWAALAGGVGRARVRVAGRLMCGEEWEGRSGWVRGLVPPPAIGESESRGSVVAHVFGGVGR